MNFVPFSVDLAVELAQREQFFNDTRSQRCTSAQSLLLQCSPRAVTRDVIVLTPYTTLEGLTRYRKVTEHRTAVV